MHSKHIQLAKYTIIYSFFPAFATVIMMISKWSWGDTRLPEDCLSKAECHGSAHLQKTVCNYNTDYSRFNTILIANLLSC